jgi:hypothetical protein
MFASAECVLGIGTDAAQARLASLARDGSLGDASCAAYWSGIRLLMRVTPPGGLTAMSRLAGIRVLDPVYGVGAMTIGMRWEAIDATGGMFPVLDADMVLSPEHGRRTRLALTGCFRAPFGGLDVPLDRTLLQSVAEFILRSAVASIAASLEGTAHVAGGIRRT